MLVHVCNPKTEEAGAGESLVQGQPGLHSKLLSPKRKENPLSVSLETMCLVVEVPNPYHASKSPGGLYGKELKC
jgi:hypothetical protein